MKKLVLLGLLFYSFSIPHEVCAITRQDEELAKAEAQRASLPRDSRNADLTAPKEPTGLEWLQMSIGQRMNSVILAMAVLAKHGIKLQATPNDYYNAVEDMLKKDPDLYYKSITSILASYVYKSDPSSRAILDKFRSF